MICLVGDGRDGASGLYEDLKLGLLLLGSFLSLTIGLDRFLIVWFLAKSVS